MANRPGKLCELEKGKLIDTQQGFADTFNFAVKAIDNLSGGKNCEVDWTIPDHPVINVDIPETESGGGGGGGGGNVEDVSSETYQGGESIKVEHSDGSADTHIPLSFVKDVSSETYQGSPSIKVEYSNGNADGHIPLPSVSTDTVDVITGISFSFDNNTNELKATLTKKRLTVISKSDISNGTAGLKIWKHDVVISSEYSTQNHQFKNKLTSGVVTNQTIDTSTTHDSSPVFTATAHSSE